MTGSQAPLSCIMMVGGVGCLAHPLIMVLTAVLAHHTATMVMERKRSQDVDNQLEIDEAAGIHRWVGQVRSIILFFSNNVFWYYFVSKTVCCCKISKLFFFVWMVSQSFLSKPFPTYLRQNKMNILSVSLLSRR